MKVPKLMGRLAALILIGGASLLSGCDSKGEADQPQPAPVLKSLGSTAVAAGATLTLTGEHFATTPGENKVTLTKGTAVREVVPSAATATQLTITVPADLTDGDYTVAMTARGQTSTLTGTALKVVQGALITSFTPTQYTAAGVMTLTGDRFGTDVSGIAVRFVLGGVETAATIQSVTATQLKVTIPTTLAAGEYTVRVIRQGLASVDAGTKLKIVAPITLTEVVPAAAAPGDLVLLKGNNLPERADSFKTVLIGGQTATIIQRKTDGLEVRVNGATAFSNDATISVTALGGTGTTTGKLKVGPIVTALSRSVGPVGSGIVLKVTGRGMKTTTAVKIGGYATEQLATSTDYRVVRLTNNYALGDYTVEFVDGAVSTAFATKYSVKGATKLAAITGQGLVEYSLGNLTAAPVVKNSTVGSSGTALQIAYHKPSNSYWYSVRRSRFDGGTSYYYYTIHQITPAGAQVDYYQSPEITSTSSTPLGGYFAFDGSNQIYFQRRMLDLSSFVAQDILKASITSSATPSVHFIPSYARTRVAGFIPAENRLILVEDEASASTYQYLRAVESNGTSQRLSGSERVYAATWPGMTFNSAAALLAYGTISSGYADGYELWNIKVSNLSTTAETITYRLGEAVSNSGFYSTVAPFYDADADVYYSPVFVPNGSGGTKVKVYRFQRESYSEISTTSSRISQLLLDLDGLYPMVTINN